MKGRKKMRNQRNGRLFFLWAVFALAALLFAPMRADAGRLEEIAERGTIRIGTTGDYRPMSYLNPETGEYEGIDAELSQIIAKSLGVEIEYVPTSWPTLTEDTLADKFDFALCGISRNFTRARVMAMSDGYGVGYFGWGENAASVKSYVEIEDGGRRIILYNTTERFENAPREDYPGVNLYDEYRVCREIKELKERK